MSARQDLAEIIGGALGDSNNGNLNKFVADQVIAAGYAKPTTTHHEAAADAAAFVLPEGGAE